MATEVSISNSALIKIGEPSITSMVQGTKTSNLCQTRIASCRDAVYAKHPWRWLRKRVILAPEVTTPEFQYSYQYAIPADCVRPVQVTDTAGEQIEECVVEGSKILANESAICLIYLERKTDLTDMPEYMAELIAIYLASDIAYAVTQIAATRDHLLQMFALELRTARGLDSQGDAPRDVYGEDFLLSRVNPNRQIYRYRNVV